MVGILIVSLIPIKIIQCHREKFNAVLNSNDDYSRLCN